MHRTLHIREILCEIFGYCLPAPSDTSNSKANLAALARTCQTFKEPALDVLWEELTNLSPLARCLPEACRKDGRYYSFSRPLSEAEWNTLRGYTLRVRFIHQSLRSVDDSIAYTLENFSDVLFPNLQSLSWKCLTTLPVMHTAVPSLTSLNLGFLSISGAILRPEILDILGERCPNIRKFAAFCIEPGSLDTAVSRQLCRWGNLECVDCSSITLNMDIILNLPSASTLKQLSFTLGGDLGTHIAHLGPVPILSSLVRLTIQASSLTPITNLFSRIQLPKIQDLLVDVLEYAPKSNVLECWTAVKKACPSNTLTRLSFSASNQGTENSASLDEQRRPWLTSDHLLPYKEFGNLHRIDINVAWSVRLTDADILDVVSTSPGLQVLMINYRWGWKMDDNGGGITLRGLVQLLRHCPSLGHVALAIDTQTFTQIPHGLDVSFPPRNHLSLNYLDSYIAPESLPDVTSVFATLKLDAHSFYASMYLH